MIEKMMMCASLHVKKIMIFKIIVIYANFSKKL
jgi:hypothetical protein